MPGVRGRKNGGGCTDRGPQPFMAWLTLGLLPGLTLLDRPEAVRQGLLEDLQQGPREGQSLRPESRAWAAASTRHQPSLSLALVKSRAAAAIPVSGGGRALWLMGPAPSAEAPRAGHALAPAKEQSLSNLRSNSRGTLHPFSCLLWVSPQLSQLALALFQLTLGPNSSSNYFPLASPNPCHSTILGRVGELGGGAWTLWEWLRRNGGASPLRLVISAPQRASKFHSLRLLWPPSPS